MTRDELILECRDIVKNLVKKYNNHRLDEDLVSTGMVEVVKCVDKCLQDGLTDEAQIKARCNVWARNMILKQLYKERIKCVDDDSAFETLKAPDSLWETVAVLKTTLSKRNNEVLEALLSGKNQNEITQELGMSKDTYFHHLHKIKEKIKSLPGSKDVD